MNKLRPSAGKIFLPEGNALVQPRRRLGLQFAEEAREHGAGKDGCRNGKHQSVEQCAVDVGFVQNRYRGGGGMRRQVSVGHRKRCRKRNSQAHQRHPGSARQGVDQRDQDQEAGVVNHRQSHQEAGRQHGELHPAGAKQVREGVADGMGGATLLDEFAKNGAEDQHQNEAAHCVADAFQNRPQRSFGAHPVEHAHKKRCQQERQKRVQFQPDDQQKEEDDREREQYQGHRREQDCCAASNRRYSAGDKAREIAPHVIPRPLRA